MKEIVKTTVKIFVGTVLVVAGGVLIKNSGSR